MFKKLLIANRGEIAVRIIRAARELGIQTVAVYSEADKDSLHTILADEAICIGPARSTESYLNMNRVLSAAIVTGAQAIHPGFGFLSENSKFSTLCEEMNIKFIGPSGEVMDKMGDKINARAEMIKANVPVIPGSDGEVFTAEEALEVANRLREFVKSALRKSWLLLLNRRPKKLRLPLVMGQCISKKLSTQPVTLRFKLWEIAMVTLST